MVAAAVGDLDGVVRDVMAKTGVPGIAVGVVYRDQVVYLKGFGVRRVGQPGAVDPDTVFQLASVSKPLASTVVARLVGEGTIAWDDPVTKYDPGFILADPWITSHVTIADLFSHRGGLPDHAGDLLEDLGYDRDYIMRHLRFQPLGPFRTGYGYTNFGFTEAAVAAAKATGESWEDLARDVLYQPLGMRSTSSRFSDYDTAPDRAATHVHVDGSWRPRYVRDADAQSPAGGVSSTARDMTRWMRLQLGDGTIDGDRLVDAASLARTWWPETVAAQPTAPAGRTGFYGLGWNVSYDDQGRLRLNHSGGFELGAATTVTLVPSEHLGIVVLTNGEPVGAPEAIAATFLDLATNGRPRVDWLGLFGRVFGATAQSERSATDYAKPPPHVAPAQSGAAYVGTYTNDYYGPLRITNDKGELTMWLGPVPTPFALRHYDGSVFSYLTRGENAVGRSGVTFTLGANGVATKVTVENLNHTGLGVFTRG